MRVSFVIAALAAVASASSVSKRQIPSCALACMTSADTGSCSNTDNTCLCSSKTFVEQTYSCIANTCKGDDLEQASAAARALCIAAGVTLTETPTAASTGASATGTTPATTASTPTSTSSNNGAINLSGSPMIGALAAVAGVVFAL